MKSTAIGEIAEYLFISMKTLAFSPIRELPAGVMGADAVRFGGIRFLLSSKRCEDLVYRRKLLTLPFDRAFQPSPNIIFVRARVRTLTVRL